MRTSLIIFGVIFLVLGILLYLVPMQEIKADTTTTNGENVDARTSSASVTVPIEWAYASTIIGFILLILGLMIPNIRNNSRKDSYEKVVESKENMGVGNGKKRKIVRERIEKHSGRKDEDSD